MSKAAKGPAKRGRKDNDSDAGTDDPGTVGTFETLRDEAEHFVHVKLYEKAIESFTKALDMKPDDKTCLVIRSKCYLMLGNAEKALADAEAALSQDDDGKKDIRALNMKAEALYQKGDFENALVFYHRGNKLRPELQEFRLGIQKCEESIDNSIGDPAAVHLEAKGDLSSFYKQNENLQNKKKQQKGYTKVNQPKKEEKKERQRPQDSSKSKTTKELLGQLYQDKEFLEKLFDSLSNNGNKTDDFIKGRACDGLEYLNSRSDFWRQQKPMYARMRDQKKAGGKGSAGNQGGDGMKYVLAKLEEIDEAQAEGRYQDSLDKCKLTIKRVEKMPEESLKNKPSVLANLYSAMGNAYLEQGKYTQALDWHNKDLDLAKENHLDEAESRALDNLGRTHAKMGQYQEAVDIWKCKLPQSKTPLESTWLYHEIGRCYLELGNNKEAKEYGEKSLTSAQEADDAGWQLHARVLIAQSEVKCEELEAASDSFTLALELAEQQNDKAAQNAIKKALQDVNDKIVERDGQGDSEEDQQKTSEETKDSDHEKGDSEKEDRESPKGHDHKKEGKEEDSDTTKVDHSGPVKKDNSEKHNSKDETHISNEDKTIKTEEEEQKDANITDQAEGHKENA
ncbi:outer dynein arm-docking complex subunit 4-like isoform X1 [Biomphalaria glabrata]|uniref:Outer dynein arm-docking complex subunit 4 n=2 Tax=Biomphalaria glabrata TaxID=6526 RepID=A0A9W2ZHE4_BIOGL|nr:outer dynein arm-docking complex subunit 4-like isoform X1 [Biomphalaria glabrata]